ncbi:LacI family DNA-binding transcriptional regulator [Agromyces italicus]|uniref:LacI family DNA-binding transcriptional regulator n=1 Tax=Agromyces italicus TaxID=279572 RepID=UPI0003B4272D|nr:LacI family DNA-binding transcriptional regulator [Agromyces italicus]
MSDVEHGVPEAAAGAAGEPVGALRQATARAVGVREVAALAGVSRQTVSRVLNDHPEVATATKERVLAAMGELDYRMNNAARALGTRRSRTFGVLASDALQYGPSRSIAAVESAARAAGYWVSAAFVDSGDAASVTAAVEHLLAQSVEGLVVVAPHARTIETLDVLEIGVPVVTLHSAGHDARSFSVDQSAGARAAVGCLADAGHRRVAHLAGPADWLEAEARRAGYLAELETRGLETGPVIAGDWTARSGFAAAAAVVDSGVTGVFAANDQMALGLIGGLRAVGVAVPEDLSIVGFDDMPDAAYLWPALTTVRQDFEELAHHAVERLVALAGSGAGIAGSRARSSLGEEAPLIVPELVVRASVVPPRRDPQ